MLPSRYIGPSRTSIDADLFSKCLWALRDSSKSVWRCVTRSVGASQAIADRLLIHHRLDLARRGTRWACTQTLVCTIDEGRLATIDLLCSGFREIQE